MNFFTNISDSIKRKAAEAKDRREFKDMVEAKAKPIRREAYMEQTIREAVNEGKEMAKSDVANKKSSKKKKPEDFGISRGLSDPYKYLRKPTS